MARKRKSTSKSPSDPQGSRPRTAELRIDLLYHQVREILNTARGRAWQAVNATMVEAYWDVGRAIVEEEQLGKEKADYGRRVIDGLSQRLRDEFGKGFDRSNLFHMRAFFLAYPKVDALRRQLSWTHFRLLLRVENPIARAFYEVEAVNARWSTREPERQIEWTAPDDRDRSLHRQERGRRPICVARGEHPDLCLTLQTPPAD